MSGIPGMLGIPREGIPPAPPNMDVFEVDEEEEEEEKLDEDIMEEEEEDIFLDMSEDIMEDGPPPNFMSPIIFFIMSSMSRDMPAGAPIDIIGIPPGPPPEVVVDVDDDEDDEEKDMEDLVDPSGLCVEAAIIWEASWESCLTAVLPSSVV